MSAYKCWCGRSLSSAAQCVVHGSGYESPQDGTVAILRAQLADALRERDEYERLLDFAADKGARLLGERDAALANVAVLRDALLVAARSAEALKRECGMDPESPQAVRNSEYMNISYAARNALEKTR